MTEVPQRNTPPRPASDLQNQILFFFLFAKLEITSSLFFLQNEEIRTRKTTVCSLNQEFLFHWILEIDTRFDAMRLSICSFIRRLSLVESSDWTDWTSFYTLANKAIAAPARVLSQTRRFQIFSSRNETTGFRFNTLCCVSIYLHFRQIR